MNDGSAWKRPALGLHLIVGLLCSIAVSNSLHAGQQEPNVQQQHAPYPWEQKFPGCEQAEEAPRPICMVDSLAVNQIAIYHLAQLYQSEQFGELDLALANLTVSKKRFVDGTSPDSAIWRTMKVVVADEPGKAYQWRMEIPSSYFAVFAEARATYNNAWAIRGGGAGGSVSEESWQLFYKRLDDAQRILDDAPSELKALPIWNSLTMSILADNPKTAPKAEKVFRNAVKRWPTNYEFYELRLTRLVPKWGGSWEEVDEFIRYWTDQLKETDGVSLYPRLYMSLLDSGVTYDQMLIDWTMMKRGFEDLIRLNPAASYRLPYAALACVARDKETFVSALESVPLSQFTIGGKPWLPGHSFEACMKWSGHCSERFRCHR